MVGPRAQAMTSEECSRGNITAVMSRSPRDVSEHSAFTTGRCTRVSGVLPKVPVGTFCSGLRIKATKAGLPSVRSAWGMDRMGASVPAGTFRRAEYEIRRNVPTGTLWKTLRWSRHCVSLFHLCSVCWRALGGLRQILVKTWRFTPLVTSLVPHRPIG